MDKKHVFHLLANTHLDPVWLWDWREGLNEGIATCRTMLKFFDKYPEFKFIRGEASIYEQLANFAITGPGFDVSEIADRLELPLIQVMSFPHKGTLPNHPESYVSITPPSVKMLDWEHVQQQSDEAVTARISLPGQTLREMRLAPWKIYKL
jgi:hypothetical protein